MNYPDDFDVGWNGGPLITADHLPGQPLKTSRKQEVAVMQPVYQFKKRGIRHTPAPAGGADAQIIGERLEHIRRRRGRLTPHLVVDDARPVTSPLHGYFEWNDAQAADNFRVIQAKEIIASVYIVMPSELQPEPVLTRAFVSVETQADAHFEPIATVLSDAQLYAQVCRRAHAELMSFQERYMEFFALKQIGKHAADAVEQELHVAEQRREQVAS